MTLEGKSLVANWLFPPLLKAPVSRETLKHIHNWVSEEDKQSRAHLGEKGMGKDRRKVALDDLAKKTIVRKINGENHYLLHRSMSSEEFAAHSFKNDTLEIAPKRQLRTGPRKFVPLTNFTSWGTHPQNVPYLNRHNIVASWIPESHISFYPLSYSEQFDKMYPFSSAGRFVKDEHEVIVKPGKFAVQHAHRVDPTRVNDFGQKDYWLKPADIQQYRQDLHRKLNGQG